MKGRKRKIGMIVLAVGCMLSGCENKIENGTDLLEKGDFQGAIAVFEEVAAEDSKQKEADIAEAYRGIGMASYELEDYEAARSNLQKALDAGGTETPAIYYLMGICAMHLEDYDGALQAFEKGTALPQEAVLSADTEEEEQVDYQAAIQEMLRNRVVCYEKKLDWANAKAAMAEYVARYPEDTEVQKEAEFLQTR
ncbi:MAG: tetratricopeptide repeat protein [Ruminococcus sp.]|nr:tetratricopeptide repeat protein [Ruminococcus sp.]